MRNKNRGNGGASAHVSLPSSLTRGSAGGSSGVTGSSSHRNDWLSLPGDSGLGDAEEDDSSFCPLCIELFDETDARFRPCPCGYHVCLFCYEKIKLELNGLCPSCRVPYGDPMEAGPAHPPSSSASSSKSKVSKSRPSSPVDRDRGDRTLQSQTRSHGSVIQAHGVTSTSSSLPTLSAAIGGAGRPNAWNRSLAPSSRGTPSAPIPVARGSSRGAWGTSADTDRNSPGSFTNIFSGSPAGPSKSAWGGMSSSFTGTSPSSVGGRSNSLATMATSTTATATTRSTPGLRPGSVGTSHASCDVQRVRQVGGEQTATIAVPNAWGVSRGSESVSRGAAGSAPNGHNGGGGTNPWGIVGGRVAAEGGSGGVPSLENGVGRGGACTGIGDGSDGCLQGQRSCMGGSSGGQHKGNLVEGWPAEIRLETENTMAVTAVWHAQPIQGEHQESDLLRQRRGQGSSMLNGGSCQGQGGPGQRQGGPEQGQVGLGQGQASPGQKQGGPEQGQVGLGQGQVGPGQRPGGPGQGQAGPGQGQAGPRQGQAGPRQGQVSPGQEHGGSGQGHGLEGSVIERSEVLAGSDGMGASGRKRKDFGVIGSRPCHNTSDRPEFVNSVRQCDSGAEALGERAEERACHIPRLHSSRPCMPVPYGDSLSNDAATFGRPRSLGVSATGSPWSTPRHQSPSESPSSTPASNYCPPYVGPMISVLPSQLHSPHHGGSLISVGIPSTGLQIPQRVNSSSSFQVLTMEPSNNLLLPIASSLLGSSFPGSPAMMSMSMSLPRSFSSSESPAGMTAPSSGSALTILGSLGSITPSIWSTSSPGGPCSQPSTTSYSSSQGSHPSPPNRAPRGMIRASGGLSAAFGGLKLEPLMQGMVDLPPTCQGVNSSKQNISGLPGSAYLQLDQTAGSAQGNGHFAASAKVMVTPPMSQRLCSADGRGPGSLGRTAATPWRPPLGPQCGRSPADSTAPRRIIGHGHVVGDTGGGLELINGLHPTARGFYTGGDGSHMIGSSPMQSPNSWQSHASGSPRPGLGFGMPPLPKRGLECPICHVFNTHLRADFDEHMGLCRSTASLVE